MPIKYFNDVNENKFERRNDQIYENDLTRVLTNSHKVRKIADMVISNEMAKTNMNDIQTDCMEFQIGGLDPKAEGMYDEKKEDVVMVLNNLMLDSPPRTSDLLNEYSRRFRFLDEGGTDCIAMYFQYTGHTEANYVIPILTARHHLERIVQAVTTLKTSVVDEEYVRDGTVSRTAALRDAWKYCVNSAYKEAMGGDFVDSCHVTCVDFLNKIAPNWLESEFEHEPGRWLVGGKLETMSTYLLRQGLNLYESKTREGGIKQNELGSFVASLFGLPEGIFFPQLAALNEDWTERTVNFQESCPWLETFFPGYDNKVPPYSVNNAMADGYKHFMPQYSDKWWPTTVSLSTHLYPFLWLARSDDFNLNNATVAKMMANDKDNIMRVIQMYGIWTCKSHVAGDKEELVDFTNMFGTCSLVIPQSADLLHNVITAAPVTAEVKFTAVNAGNQLEYVPRLITPGISNVWNVEKDPLPAVCFILSQKFGSKPPFRSCSKMVLYASLYAYSKL